MDLFNDIEKAYEGNVSIFDNITKDDIILAFFPCVRFEVQIIMQFKGTSYGFDKWSDERKLEYDLKLHKELALLYEMVTKLALICINRKIPLIIENPYSSQHYLTRYWALEPVVIDSNRREWGDYFTKPTQYWFINCKPKNNLIMDEPIAVNEKKLVDKLAGNKVERSMISKDYARKFIRTYICD